VDGAALNGPQAPAAAASDTRVCVIGKIGYNQSNEERASGTHARFVVQGSRKKSGQLDVPPEERSERFLQGNRARNAAFRD
jgi:hypothetical protein